MRKIACRLSAVVLLILCSLVSGPGVGRATIVMDKVVAVVNDDVITWSELYRAMEMDASPQLKALPAAEKNKIFKANETSFLENLINLRLQVQEAEKKGVRISEEEVQEAVDTIKKKYGLSDEAFKESLRREGYTFDEYRRRMYEQILVSKLVNQVIRSKIVLTEQEVSDFIAKNPKLLEETEGYRISQIFFRRPKTSEEQASVEARATEVMAKLREGADFSELARQYSEDPSASSGGDMGFIAKSSLAKDFAATLSALKAGELSKPFWTQAGLHILKLQEKVEAGSNKGIEAAAREKLFGKIYMERYNSWVKSLREKAFIEIRD